MKCYAKQIMGQRAIAEANREMGCYFLAFIDASSGVILHEQCGCGRKRLQQFYNDSESALNDTMEFYYSDGEEVRETALTTLTALKRKLKDECGFDYDAITREMPWADKFNETWHPRREIHKHETRLNYAENIAVATDTYYLNALTFVRSEYKHGKERLTRLYKRLREDYNRFVGSYLLCNAKGDKAALDLLEQRQKQIVDMGLELEPIDKDENVTQIKK